MNAKVAQSKNFPFGVNTTIGFKNIETASSKNGIWQVMLQLISVPVLLEAVLTFFSSFVALTPNWHFCIVPLLH